MQPLGLARNLACGSYPGAGGVRRLELDVSLYRCECFVFALRFLLRFQFCHFTRKCMSLESLLFPFIILPCAEHHKNAKYRLVLERFLYLYNVYGYFCCILLK